MTLESAISEFEALFKSVAINPAADGEIICSGAVGLPDHPPPVLCATPELAIALWTRCAKDYADELAWTDMAKSDLVLTWIREPQLLRFKMTIMDAMSAHRVATDRFAVYSVLVISEPEQGLECPASMSASKPDQAPAEKATSPDPDSPAK